jgi:hypothetical protein
MERKPEYKPTWHPLNKVKPSIGQPLRPHYAQTQPRGLPQIHPHHTKWFAHYKFLLILGIVAVLIIGFIVIFTLLGEEQPTFDLPGERREGVSPIMEEVAELEEAPIVEEVEYREGLPEEAELFIPVIAGKEVEIDNTVKGIQETDSAIKVDLETAASIIEAEIFGE